MRFLGTLTYRGYLIWPGQSTRGFTPEEMLLFQGFPMFQAVKNGETQLGRGTYPQPPCGGWPSRQRDARSGDRPRYHLRHVLLREHPY
eukprot:2877132-Pyramimonas_sp.AAC.1